MTRTTIRTEAALLLALAAAGPGCSREYEHQRLGAESAESAAIRRMLEEVREAGEEGIDTVLAHSAAEGLNDSQQAFLKGTLLRLAQAESVELIRSDRFGEEICRATFRLKGEQNTRDVSVLLVDAGSGRLRWFQPN